MFIRIHAFESNSVFDVAQIFIYFFNIIYVCMCFLCRKFRTLFWRFNVAPDSIELFLLSVIFKLFFFFSCT